MLGLGGSGVILVHSAGHPWPSGDPLAQARSVPPKQGGADAVGGLGVGHRSVARSAWFAQLAFGGSRARGRDAYRRGVT